MLRLIERSIERLDDGMVLLAPAHATMPAAFEHITCDPLAHRRLVHAMQALRGDIYLREGNVKASQLTADGRHETPEDDRSWHLLMTAPDGSVTGCVLYLEHESTVTPRDLRISHCPLAESDTWGGPLTRALSGEIQRARRAGLHYTEIGGLAVEPSRRGSPDGVLLALATYALGRMRGGAIGVTTANVAHACSSILRRLGGAPLSHNGAEIPPYFDPRYATDIELLRFDSRLPSPKYAPLIDAVEERLAMVPVVAAGAWSEAPEYVDRTPAFAFSPGMMAAVA